MTTRRMQLEETLQKTKEDLKEQRDLSERLLNERDDHEVEMRTILSKNSVLKRQLAELDADYQCLWNKCEQQQCVIDSSSQCRATHVEALERVRFLEQQLEEVREDLLFYTNYARENNLKRLSLHAELAICQPGSISVAPVDDSSPTSPRIMNSRKSIKRYIKIKKTIKTYNNAIKKLSTVKNYNPLINRVVDLRHLVHVQRQTIAKLEINLSDANNLIDQLTVSIKENAEISEQNHKLMELLLEDLDQDGDCSSGGDSFHPTSAPEVSTCPSSSSPSPPAPRTETQQTPILEKPLPEVIENVLTLSNEGPQRTVIYSDSVGVGLGSLLNNCLNQAVTNVCMPGCTFTQIVNKIMTQKLDSNMSIILWVGNSSAVNKRELISNFDRLQNLNVKKIILCGFPFIASESNMYNQKIHRHNTLMYNMTCYQSSQKIFYFDVNKFIKKATLYKGTVCLAYFYKKQIANLLACNISDMSIIRRQDSVSNITNNNIFLN